MRTITFLFDIAMVMVFVCACTINLTAYYKAKHVRELEIGMLMFFYCMNSMHIVMSEFLNKSFFFEGAYNVLTYFGVKAACGIAISILYMCLTAELLEKKLGVLKGVIILPLICVTIYVGDLNASVRQHWLFYTIRQIYLAGFTIYYFISYAVSTEKDYKMRIKRYRPIFILAAVFAVLIFAEDSLVIFNFQYVINTLNLKIFMEHNLSEDMFFLIMAVLAIRFGLNQLLQSRESMREEPAAAAQLQFPAHEQEETTPENQFSEKYALSRRQRDVLSLLLSDKSYQEMGDELGLSVGTVKFHAHGIYEKTESRNRSELNRKYREFLEAGMK